MNYTELDRVAAFYLRHYDEIRVRENYKWEAVRTYQEADPMRAASFPDALKQGLSGAGNLLDSGYYFPKTALLMMLSKDPEAVRLMMEDLFRSEDDIFDRVTVFMMKARELRRKYFTSEELPDDDQDEHAVSVYLAFQEPQNWYLYKFSVFRKTALIFDHPYVPQRSDARNLSEYYRFCEKVRAHLLENEELLRREAKRHAQYPEADPAYRLLTEDILICASSYYQSPELFEEEGTEERAQKFRLKPVKKTLPLEPLPFYDPVEIARYEEELRDSAIRFVLTQERLKVRGYRLPPRKHPEAMTAGAARGAGYDVLSYNRRGEEIFISVKVTSGPESEAFRIDESERRKSALDPEHYRLYRIYSFDTESGSGKYSVYRGDLTPLCLNAETYRVMF